MIRSRIAIFGLVAGLAGADAAAVDRVRTVPSVDLSRYAGEWFEIARFPNRFQTKCAGEVRAQYRRRDDGRIDVVNSCRTANGEDAVALGVARVVDTKSSAQLKVRFAPAMLSFLPFVWGDYWIIGLADDYRWAVVGSPDRNYLWVLSRSASMSEAVYGEAIATAKANGFDTARLERTRQR